MSRTVLILVRHGATQANVCRPHRLQGLRPDSELIEQGKEQARAVGREVWHCSIDRVYSSPLRRARQTAQLIAEPLGMGVRVEEGIVEADIGQWTDLSWPEIEQRWPEEYRAFHEDPERHGYLGGENLSQVLARAQPAIEKLVARHGGKTILVVSHGAVNRVLLAHWLGVPLRYARRIPQDNAACNIAEFEGGEMKVRTVNCTLSLQAKISYLVGVPCAPGTLSTAGKHAD